MTRSRFLRFSDVKVALDAKVKAVNDAVSAKVQSDAKLAQDAARDLAAASTSSKRWCGYNAPARRGCNGIRALSHNGWGNYRALSE